MPIDPPYIGRVAGPLARDAADAALMMATLSLPDVRDHASLKYEKLDWAVKPADLKALEDRPHAGSRLWSAGLA